MGELNKVVIACTALRNSSCNGLSPKRPQLYLNREKRVVERVKSQLSDEETFARLGGDEFGIILNESCDVVDLATRIIELVQRTYLIDGSPVNIGVSIGVASTPLDAHERSGLVRCDDLSLCQAKSAGRNASCTSSPKCKCGLRISVNWRLISGRR
jgi:predicted signal transduction protein with EAL and GGDEF domain